MKKPDLTDKTEKKIFKKFKKELGKVKVKGIMLYDPRTKRLWPPGNNNPALILRDLMANKRYGMGIKLTKEQDQWIAELADYCDAARMGLDAMVVKTKKSAR